MMIFDVIIKYNSKYIKIFAKYTEEFFYGRNIVILRRNCGITVEVAPVWKWLLS